jgi:hypothetical protein
MPQIVVVATEGRFKIHLQAAIKRFKGPLPASGTVEINLLDTNGNRWLPTSEPLTAQAKDLFDTNFDRGDILDRAADLQSRQHWLLHHDNTKGYFEWAQHQRQRLHKAILSWTLPPTMWDRL